MFEFISERPNVEDWRHDLNLSFQHLGIYRMAHYKSALYEELKKLNTLLSEYEGVVPSLYYNNIDRPYWYKLEVRVNNSMQKFPIKFIRSKKYFHFYRDNEHLYK